MGEINRDFQTESNNSKNAESRKFYFLDFSFIVSNGNWQDKPFKMCTAITFNNHYHSQSRSHGRKLLPLEINHELLSGLPGDHTFKTEKKLLASSSVSYRPSTKP